MCSTKICRSKISIEEKVTKMGTPAWNNFLQTKYETITEATRTFSFTMEQCFINNDLSVKSFGLHKELSAKQPIRAPMHRHKISSTYGLSIMHCITNNKQ
mmetsp:Transcript_5174/g.14923  ORF Transcript_5174/g.14923 Transcript_5174/m.14923 type:complete len:100 (-) Transcript_5174:433-732(-)